MTHIEWADKSWNPVTGCSKVSPGCANCYAERMALTRLAGREGYPGLPWTEANAAQNVALRPDRLDQPLKWRKPCRVFVNSMSDLFHERVNVGFQDAVFDTMARCPQHTFQVLTKRAERMFRYIDGRVQRTRPLVDPPLCKVHAVLSNVWLGVSIENDRQVGRGLALRDTPAAVRFISAEPLLGPLPSLDLTGIDWLIIGGESGPGHRPMDPAWVQKLVHRADRAGVAVFIKQDSGYRSGQQGRLPDHLWKRKEHPR